jgi:hypothetical protein
VGVVVAGRLEEEADQLLDAVELLIAAGADALGLGQRANIWA